MKERFIVKFNGGLGNQMFQWAFAKGAEQRTGMKAVFDMSFFEKRYARPFELDIFGIEPEKISKFSDKVKLSIIWKLRRKLNNKKFMGIKLISEENPLEYCDFDITPETYIEGFFQSEKYFKDIDLGFEFKEELKGRNKEIAEDIENSESVSLHIRRGDYVKKKVYQNMFATCSLDYYKRAVDIITNIHPRDNYKLFIFSDDIAWVKENLKLPYEMVYVDFNKGKDSYNDMRLMSLCKHNVIANSSFSWWGAYLNKNQYKVVVSPQKWFNDETQNQQDVIPEKWIRIEN